MKKIILSITFLLLVISCSHEGYETVVIDKEFVESELFIKDDGSKVYKDEEYLIVVEYTDEKYISEIRILDIGKEVYSNINIGDVYITNRLPGDYLNMWLLRLILSLIVIISALIIFLKQ